MNKVFTIIGILLPITAMILVLGYIGLPDNNTREGVWIDGDYSLEHFEEISMDTDLETLLNLCDDIENYNGPNLASNNGTHWISLEFCQWHEFSGNHTLGSLQWKNLHYSDDDKATIRVVDSDMNFEPQAVNSFDIDVWSDTDAQGIQLSVTETGDNTKVFEGTIYFSSNDESSGARLLVNNGDTVSARYNDTTTSDSDTYFEIIKSTTILDDDTISNASIKWDKEQYALHNLAILTIEDPDMNIDPTKYDILNIHLWSDYDSKGLYLPIEETRKNSGIFKGWISLSDEGNSVGAKLRVANGDYMTAKYNDTSIPFDREPFFEIKQTVLVRNEGADLDGIKVHKITHPSPSKMQFTGVTDNHSDVIQIKILDNNGNQLKDAYKFSWGIEKFEIEIDFENPRSPMKDGTYFLVLTQDYPNYYSSTQFTVKNPIDTTVNQLE